MFHAWPTVSGTEMVLDGPIVCGLVMSKGHEIWVGILVLSSFRCDLRQVAYFLWVSVS